MALRPIFIMMNSISTDSIHTPTTNDEFINEGYSQAIIKPSERLNELIEPFCCLEERK